MYLELFNLIIVAVSWGTYLLVQFVDYPLYRFVPKKALRKYEAERTRRIMIPAVSLFVLEIALAIALLFYSNIPLPQQIAGLIIILVIQLITWIKCVPTHISFEKGASISACTRLLNAHAVRCILYTGRLILAISWVLG